MKNHKPEKHGQKKLEKIRFLLRVKNRITAKTIARDPLNPSEYLFDPSYVYKILLGRCRPSRKFKVENAIARALGKSSWSQL
jgi:hypothetical protein